MRDAPCLLDEQFYMEREYAESMIGSLCLFISWWAAGDMESAFLVGLRLRGRPLVCVSKRTARRLAWLSTPAGVLLPQAESQRGEVA